LAGRGGVNIFVVFLDVALYRAYLPVIRQLLPYSLIGCRILFISFLAGLKICWSSYNSSLLAY
jgi:uncharacterized membrane protein required for colicin V production